MAQLSLTEVSKRFSVNRTTIYRSVQSGKLSRLNNGLFDLSEIIRVFGEPELQKGSTEKLSQSNDKEIISILKNQIELLTNQLEKKDYQIDHLQRLLVAPETSQKRNNETDSCNSLKKHNNELLNNDKDRIETSHEANSNVTKQHNATVQNDTVQHDRKRGLLNRFDKGIKAFFG